MTDFVTIPVTDHHREILQRNKTKIAEFYKLEGDIKLIEVSAKIIHDSGAYYKFTLLDANKKSAIVKVDDLHTRARWDGAQWAQQEVNRTI